MKVSRCKIVAKVPKWSGNNDVVKGRSGVLQLTIYICIIGYDMIFPFF